MRWDASINRNNNFIFLYRGTRRPFVQEVCIWAISSSSHALLPQASLGVTGNLFQGNNLEVSWLLKKQNKNLCNKHQIGIRPLTLVSWVHPKLSQRLFQFVTGVNCWIHALLYPQVLCRWERGFIWSFFPAGRSADEDSVSNPWIRFQE